jgi:hypothetical protein
VVAAVQTTIIAVINITTAMMMIIKALSFQMDNCTHKGSTVQAGYLERRAIRRVRTEGGFCMRLVGNICSALTRRGR